MLIQRDYADPQQLKEHISQIINSLDPYLHKSGRESIFVYLVHHLQITYEEFIEIQKVIPIENQERMKSLYDHLIEHGIERGKQQGIELGIERGKEQGIELGIEKSILNAFDHKIDLPTIQVITGESLEKIKRVLAKHGRM